MKYDNSTLHKYLENSRVFEIRSNSYLCCCFYNRREHRERSFVCVFQWSNLRFFSVFFRHFHFRIKHAPSPTSSSTSCGCIVFIIIIQPQLSHNKQPTSRTYTSAPLYAAVCRYWFEPLILLLTLSSFSRFCLLFSLSRQPVTRTHSRTR